MPVTNTRDVIPFVNELEKDIGRLTEQIGTWLVESQKVKGYGTEIADIRFRTTGAFSRAEEALSEIGNATTGVVALKGQRLKKLIEDLKREVRVIAEEAAASGGGGGAFFDERITKEINNAVAGVSSLVPEGLKLDARIQQIAELATNGGELGNKQLVVPVARTLTYLGGDEFALAEEEDLVYVDGEVAFALPDGGTALTRDGKAAVGTVVAVDGGRTGRLTMPDVALGEYRIFVPAEIAMHAWPREAIEAVLGASISRTSGTFKKIAEYGATLDGILDTIARMKGQGWTADVTLMQNRRDIVRESITPKGLQVEILPDGKAAVSFSYTDHPGLSHFVLEKMDADEKWVPYDGDQGIITAE